MGDDEVVADLVQPLGRHAGDDILPNHIQGLGGQTASQTHRSEILRPMKHNPPGFGAAIHHQNILVHR